jgi:hypothetical protein
VRGNCQFRLSLTRIASRSDQAGRGKAAHIAPRGGAVRFAYCALRRG